VEPIVDKGDKEMTDFKKPEPTQTSTHPKPVPTPKVEAVQTKPTLAGTILPPPPKEVENTIPDGAIDINLVRPGFGPLEGSPKENDPTQLANPNNPLSPITRPLNPSNPANQPAMQSEKPASEVRMFQTLNPPVSLEAQTKAAEERKAKLAESFKGISDILTEFGSESAIPPGHAYWGMLNEHRALANP